MGDDSADAARLTEQARAGDPQVLGEMFERHRDRLRRVEAIGP
jgi:hypothetical protein